MAEQRTKTLAEQTAGQLTAYITKHELKKGDKLPNEYELAHLLKVGRSTLREAIRILAARNALVVRHGSGTYISDMAGASDDPLGLALIQDKGKLALDLLEIRLMIEPKIAGMAAENRSEEGLAEMQLACEKMEALIQQHQPYAEYDRKFHTLIAKRSGNLVMPTLIPTIYDSIDVIIDLFHHKPLSQETIEIHNEIHEAIRSHDVNSAYDAMTLHLILNRRHLKKMIDSL